MSDQDHPAWPTADDDLSSERPGKTDQAEQADQAGTADQAGHDDQAGKPGPTDRAAHSQQPDQSDWLSPTGWAGQSEQADRTGQDDQASHAEPDSGQADDADWSHQPGRTSQDSWMSQADEAGQGAQVSQGDHGGQVGLGDWASQVGPDSSQAGQGSWVSQADEGAQLDRASQGDHGGQTGHGDWANQAGPDSRQADSSGDADWANQPDRSGQSSWMSQADEAGQGQAGHGDWASQAGPDSGQTHRVSDASQAGQGSWLSQADEAGQGAQVSQGDRRGQVGHGDWADQAGPDSRQADSSGDADWANQPGRAGQDSWMSQADEAGQGAQASQGDRGGQVGRGDWADQAGPDSGQPHRSSDASQAGQGSWMSLADEAGQRDRVSQGAQTSQSDRGQAGHGDWASQVGPDSSQDHRVSDASQAGQGSWMSQAEDAGHRDRVSQAAQTSQSDRGGQAGQSTQRIQFPMVDPDSLRPPAQKTTPIQRPGFPPPEPPRAAPMRIEPGGRPPMRPKASSFRAEQTVQVAPVRIEPPRSEQRRPEPLRSEPPPPPPPPRPPAEQPSFLSDDEPPAPAEKPKRRRTGLIVAGAIVLVIAIGAGVVFAVPGVKESLGFGETKPEVVIQPPPAPVAFTPNLRSPSAEAPTPSAPGVQAALAGPASVAALGTLTGTVLDAATGKVLWDKGASTPLVPASTLKILTGGAALLKIDHGQQYSTRAVAGPEPGSVILIGGGDPTLNSLPVGKKSWYPGSAYLDDLVAQVKANAGGKVTQVYYDSTRYTGADLAPGWLPGDVAAGYMSPTTALMMDGGRTDPTKDVTPRSANPPKSVAAEFAKRIGATVAAKPDVTAPAEAKVLGEVKSAPLTELVDNAMVASDNVLADTIAREVAKAAGEEASFAGVSKATLKILQENGFDVSGAQLTDGSGLSTNDKVPARLLAEVLAVAAGDGKDPRTAKLRPLLGGLPVAGGSGTLEGRFAPATPAASGRGWVRAKTGTLLGVNSLAGVVLDADGRMLAFALMSNGSDSAGARPALDAVAATLRGCGCK